MGVWGLCPQRGPGAEPLVRGSGGEDPPPQKLNTTIQPIFAEFWCHFGKIQSFCKLLKLGMSLGSFFRKHKRCCFDKLMYVRSIGFTLRKSTRYTIYSIMGTVASIPPSCSGAIPPPHPNSPCLSFLPSLPSCIVLFPFLLLYFSLPVLAPSPCWIWARGYNPGKILANLNVRTCILMCIVYVENSHWALCKNMDLCHHFCFGHIYSIRYNGSLLFWILLMDRQLSGISFLCYKTALIYVMHVFAGKARYHIGIWYCLTAGVS